MHTMHKSFGVNDQPPPLHLSPFIFRLVAAQRSASQHNQRKRSDLSRLESTGMKATAPGEAKSMF